ncbi:olfactory receptor 6M1-like [Alca torda]
MFLSRLGELKFSAGPENARAVTEFILEGFSGLDQRLQLFLSLVLLLIYLTTVMGNAAIISLGCVGHRLQTPMYFFISNLSFLEIWFTSSTSTKLLVILGSGRRTISLGSCFAQSYFYFALGSTEFVLLVVLSFDRYVAICQPLPYAAIMKPQLCIHLVAAAWVMGPTLLRSRLVLLCKLTFCTSQQPLPFTTCSSHLTTLAIAYGSCIALYVHPSEQVSLEANRMVALLNAVLYPFLNPFIYSLRNKTVTLALKEAIARATIKLFALSRCISGQQFP